MKIGRHGDRMAATRRARHLIVVAAVIVGAGCRGAAPQAADPAVRDAWVREPVTGQPATAAYFVIENPGPAEVVLTGVRAPFASTAELHTTTKPATAGGMMTMRRVDEIVVPAGGTLAFEPGGYHVMLFDVTAPLVDGDTAALTLEFRGGMTRTVTASVVGPAAAAPMHP